MAGGSHRRCAHGGVEAGGDREHGCSGQGHSTWRGSSAKRSEHGHDCGNSAEGRDPYKPETRRLAAARSRRSHRASQSWRVNLPDWAQRAGGLAPTIPDGMRACAVRVDEVVGVAGFVIPGMRVDVLVSGNPPGAVAADGILTKTILQNIQVLSAGTDIQRDAAGKPQQVQVVTLLVTPQQAQTLSLASNSVEKSSWCFATRWTRRSRRCRKTRCAACSAARRLRQRVLRGR